MVVVVWAWSLGLPWQFGNGDSKNGFHKSWQIKPRTLPPIALRKHHSIGSSALNVQTGSTCPHLPGKVRGSRSTITKAGRKWELRLFESSPQASATLTMFLIQETIQMVGSRCLLCSQTDTQ